MVKKNIGRFFFYIACDRRTNGLGHSELAGTSLGDLELDAVALESGPVWRGRGRGGVDRKFECPVLLSGMSRPTHRPTGAILETRTRHSSYITGRIRPA